MIHDPQEIRHLAGVIGGHVDAQPSPRIVLAILEMSPHHYVTHEDLIENYLAATFEKMLGNMDQRNISQHFKNLRQGLRKAGVPIEIKADYGLGYRMTMPDNYVPPWRATETEKDTDAMMKLTLDTTDRRYVWNGMVTKEIHIPDIENGRRTGEGEVSITIRYTGGAVDLDPEETWATVKQQPDAGGV